MDPSFIHPKKVGAECQGLDIYIKKLSRQVPLQVDIAVFPAINKKSEVTSVFTVYGNHPTEIGFDGTFPHGAINERPE